MTQYSGIGLVWFGLVIGISFIDAMLKFRVPEVSRAAALALGRQSFDFLNHIEIALTVWLMALVIVRRSRPATRLTKILIGAIFVIVLTQTVWLQPVLFHRIEMIIAGQTPPPGPIHSIYIGVEASKALVLLALGLFAETTSPEPTGMTE